MYGGSIKEQIISKVGAHCCIVVVVLLLELEMSNDLSVVAH